MKKLSKEEKELLLKDLCARLPFGVIVRHADPFIDNDGNETGEFWYKHGYLCDVCTLDDMTTTIIESEGSDEEGYEHICLLERTLPYLRPMSSMTEEERKEYNDIVKNTIDFYDCPKSDNVCFLSVPIDWLNANKFDYRDLISKGLAIEVTKNNNPYK